MSKKAVHPLPKTREEFADGMKSNISAMVKGVKAHDDPLPLFEVQSKDDKVSIFAVPDMDEKAKVAMEHALPRAFAELDPKFIGFFSSAWTVKMPADTKPEDMPTKGLSEHPLREEVAILYTASATECVAEMATISRGDAVIVTDWKKMDNAVGRFPDIIAESFALSLKGGKKRGK